MWLEALVVRRTLVVVEQHHSKDAIVRFRNELMNILCSSLVCVDQWFGSGIVVHEQLAESCLPMGEAFIRQLFPQRLSEEIIIGQLFKLIVV